MVAFQLRIGTVQMNAHTPPKFGKHVGMGQPVLRKDDVRGVDALHAFVLRSPYAHAKFSIEDADTARDMDGVELILTAADLEDHKGLRCQTLLPQTDGTPVKPKDIPLLCKDIVRHVGDAVAFVVTQTLAQAKEAAEAIEVDYDMMDATVATEASLNDTAPLVYDDKPQNLAFEITAGNFEKSNEIFKTAPRVSELKLINNRGKGAVFGRIARLASIGSIQTLLQAQHSTGLVIALVHLIIGQPAKRI